MLDRRWSRRALSLAGLDCSAAEGGDITDFADDAMPLVAPLLEELISFLAVEIVAFVREPRPARDEFRDDALNTSVIAER